MGRTNYSSNKSISKLCVSVVWLFGNSDFRLLIFRFKKKNEKGWTELCGKDVEGSCMINELSYLSIWKQLLIIQ